MQTTLNKAVCSSLHMEFKHRKHGSSIALLSGLLECMVTVLLPCSTTATISYTFQKAGAVCGYYVMSMGNRKKLCYHYYFCFVRL
jgi:hypothetical protein